MAKQHDFVKLAGEGRAYDATRAWTEEELNAVLDICHHSGIEMRLAAKYVRNGVMSFKEYEQMVEDGFEPEDLEKVKEKAVAEHKEKVAAKTKEASTKKATTKKTPAKSASKEK